MDQPALLQKAETLYALARQLAQGSAVEYHQNRHYARPIFIEFHGSPSSGKSTFIKQIARVLRNSGFSVKIVAEESLLNPLLDKLHPDFNIWNGCQILSKFMEIQNSNFQIILVDRGLFDLGCWMKFFYEREQLTNKEYKATINFFQSPRFRRLIDLIVVVTADPELSVARSHARSKNASRIHNPRVLAALNRIAREEARRCRKLFHIFSLDVSDKDNEKHFLTLLDAVIKTIHQAADSVLVLPRQEISQLRIRDGFTGNPKQIGGVLEAIKAKGYFVSREEAENSDQYLQAISITYMTHQNRVVTFRRTQHDSTPYLRGKQTVWLGSHVSPLDRHADDILLPAALRGIRKKIILEDEFRPQVTGIVIDTSNPGSSRHFGIVQHLNIAQPNLTVVRRQGELVSSVRLANIRKMHESLLSDLEPWSRALIVNLAHGTRAYH